MKHGDKEPKHEPHKAPGLLGKILNKTEDGIESFIFLSRWVQAPIYLALIVAALLYALKSIQEVLHLVLHFKGIKESEIMLGVLSLVDISMVANLVNMVVIGGYVTFVSKINFGDHHDRPDWLDKINANSLKIKLAASLASISAIHLLKSFIDISSHTNEELTWQVVIHVVFLGSMLFFAVSDWIQTKAHGH